MSSLPTHRELTHTRGFFPYPDLMPTNPPEQDPRVYFAAERTFLAWIRSGLALMGVGFAVARFGLFLRQLRATETHQAISSNGVSTSSGVAIVFLGVIVLAASVLQHLTLIRELRAGTWQPGRISRKTP